MVSSKYKAAFSMSFSAFQQRYEEDEPFAHS